MPRVAVIGGGLAGLASAVALGSAGFEVDIYEARKFLGGRATSWPVGGPQTGDNDGEMIDNCQHVLLRCCFLTCWISTGGSELRRKSGSTASSTSSNQVGALRFSKGNPSRTFAFFGSFLKLKFLGIADKIAIARAVNAIPRERRTRSDLDRLTMLDWLREKRQTDAAIERYWRQVLVSAINEELDRMAATHGFQVFWLGMISVLIPTRWASRTYRCVSSTTSILSPARGAIRIRPRSPVTAIETIGAPDDSVKAIQTAAGRNEADFYISALPFERLQPLVPSLPIEWGAFEHSPITGIHLWFDRAVTSLPHATLLDRTIQWMFNKGEGRYIQTVVSASRSMLEMPRNEIIDLAVRELAEFFPAVKEARLEKAQVIKEVRATFSAKTGLEALRPLSRTNLKNFFLAGDWTRSGWPATMEGAVRSGYLAAEAVAEAAGMTQRFLLPDVA